MKEPKTIICVNGGTVDRVFSNVHDLDVIVIDFDCRDSWGNKVREAIKVVDFVDEQVAKGNTDTEFILIY